MNDYAGHEHVDEDNLYVDQYIGIETLNEQKLFTWPLNFNT